MRPASLVLDAAGEVRFAKPGTARSTKRGSGRFARSAAAIASTMNLQLSQLPGEVSSWNLDVDALDSSGSNHRAPVGAPTFAGNALLLQGIGFPGLVSMGNPPG